MFRFNLHRACLVISLGGAVLLIGLPLAGPSLAGQAWAAAVDGDAGSRLEDVRQTIEEEKNRRDALQAKAEQLNRQMAALRADLVAAARTIQGYESKMAAMESRLSELLGAETRLTGRLAGRRQQFAAVLMALQRLARHPPEAMIVQPMSPTDTVRGAILLRAAVPELELRAARLRRDLDDLARTRKTLDRQRLRLTGTAEKLRQEQQRLEGLLSRKSVIHKQAIAKSRKAAKRAQALAREAKSLKDLLARLEKEKKKDQARLEQARLEQARLNQARLNQARLEQARLEQKKRQREAAAARAEAVAKAAATAKAVAQARKKAKEKEKATAQAEAQAEAKAEAKAEALAQAKARVEVQAEAKARTEAKALAEARAEAQARAEAKALAEARARVKKMAAQMPAAAKTALKASKQVNLVSLANRSRPSSGNGPISKARGSMPYPVVGRVVGRYGQTTETGLKRKGISVETRAGAQVTAPFDGEVVFAGPFRGYGQLLIIDHGEGYHSLLAGMAGIDSVIGQWLVAGEPVGLMGRPANGNPALYVELRKDGQPINPQPWLTARNSKVSG